MKISPNNDKIEKYLDELADEYKALLFKALVSHSKSFDELSVSELFRIDKEAKKPLLGGFQRQQRKRHTLLAMGLAYIVVSLLIFVMCVFFRGWGFYSVEEKVVPLAATILGLVGVSASFLSLIPPTTMLSSRKKKDRQIEETKEVLALLEYEVVSKWRVLEGLVNDISSNIDIEPPRSIIDFLYDYQFIDKNEHRVLKDYLKLRNHIVHSSIKGYSIGEIKEMINKVDKIIASILKIV